MAGIYIHIPFCRQACHYCDFHFSTSLNNKQPFLEALHKEIRLRKDFAQGERINTIYFGGGTPSLLSADELKRILDSLYSTHEINDKAEITLEANPDDLTSEKIRTLSATQINRLSIGIQSFRDEDLRMMNRAHSAMQADYSVKAAQDKGFENITIDLIYSIPELPMDAWKKNLDQAFTLNIQHISAYSLTIEPKTVFGSYEKKGMLKPVEQEVSSEQFLIMADQMKIHEFEQYEVSNFCRPGFESKHNSSYWKGEKYIGLGPSAHSFDGTSRQWNVSNNNLYIKALAENRLDHGMEMLDERTMLNEYLMTGLRTKWGIDLEIIRSKFHFDLEKEYSDMIADLISRKKMIRNKQQIVLTTEGLLMADKIASDLFLLEANT